MPDRPGPMRETRRSALIFGPISRFVGGGETDNSACPSSLTLAGAATIRPPSRKSQRSRDPRPRGRERIERGLPMSRRCELTGKGALVGHRVSHSNIKTKRRFLPNLFNVTMISDALGRSVKLRVSANAIKSVDHRGGLDAYLLKAKDDELSRKALDLKRQVLKKRAAAAQ